MPRVDLTIRKIFVLTRYYRSANSVMDLPVIIKKKQISKPASHGFLILFASPTVLTIRTPRFRTPLLDFATFPRSGVSVPFNFADQLLFPGNQIE